MTDSTLTLRLTIADPVPGVHYCLQDQKNVPTHGQIATEAPLSMDVPVRLHAEGRLTGPYVRREGPVRRFVYIAIGSQTGDRASPWNRRAKIDVHTIPGDLLRPDAILEVILPGRARDGGPACATVTPTLGWRPVDTPF